uniref:Uncharacterized protein n=1 Tax=Oryza barthii TaxID=65489 RepID=A0A0D3H4F3_9ORYZ
MEAVTVARHGGKGGERGGEPVTAAWRRCGWRASGKRGWGRWEGAGVQRMFKRNNAQEELAGHTELGGGGGGAAVQQKNRFCYHTADALSSNRCPVSSVQLRLAGDANVLHFGAWGCTADSRIRRVISSYLSGLSGFALALSRSTRSTGPTITVVITPPLPSCDAIKPDIGPN